MYFERKWFLICTWQLGIYYMTFYVNLIGAKTSVIGVDTKGMGQMKCVQNLMEGEHFGEIRVESMIM